MHHQGSVRWSQRTSGARLDVSDISLIISLWFSKITRLHVLHRNCGFIPPIERTTTDRFDLPKFATHAIGARPPLAYMLLQVSLADCPSCAQGTSISRSL